MREDALPHGGTEQVRHERAMSSCILRVSGLMMPLGWTEVL